MVNRKLFLVSFVIFLLSVTNVFHFYFFIPLKSIEDFEVSKAFGTSRNSEPEVEKGDTSTSSPGSNSNSSPGSNSNSSPDSNSNSSPDSNSNSSPDSNSNSSPDSNSNSSPDSNSNSSPDSNSNSSPDSNSNSSPDSNSNSTSSPDSNSDYISPVADAGTDITVQSDMLTKLDGSKSYDPNTSGDDIRPSLNFDWKQTSGPEVILNNPISANPTFTSPQVEEETKLTFQLVVSSDTATSDPDSVTVSVTPDT